MGAKQMSAAPVATWEHPWGKTAGLPGRERGCHVREGAEAEVPGLLVTESVQVPPGLADLLGMVERQLDWEPTEMQDYRLWIWCPKREGATRGF